MQEIHPDGRYTYIYTDPDSYEPLAQVHNRTNEEGESGQQTHYFHCDQIGIPREMTDGEGNLVWFGDYYGWGKLKSETNVTETAHQPFRLQNQYCDRETGLHYNFFRYYDPDAGRFVNQDPIGLMGGMNSYFFAPNSSGWIDILGLNKCSTAQDRHSDLKNSPYCQELCFAASHEKQFPTSLDFAKEVVVFPRFGRPYPNEDQFVHSHSSRAQYSYSMGSCMGNKKADIRYTMAGWAIDKQLWGGASNHFYIGYRILGSGLGGGGVNLLDKENLAGLQIGQVAAKYNSLTDFANELCGCGL